LTGLSIKIVSKPVMTNHPIPTPNTFPQEPPQSDAWGVFHKYLIAKGLRITHQRKAIFEAAFNTEDHYTAEELLERARKLDRSVSRATVYRSLPILTESRLVKEVDIGKDYKLYLSNRNATTFKAQVICVETDKIIEVDAPFMEWYGRAVAEKLGMQVVSLRLQIEARPIVSNPNT
jgi:Fur family transcriptional regulator, ferric uptake regulator